MILKVSRFVYKNSQDLILGKIYWLLLFNLSIQRMCWPARGCGSGEHLGILRVSYDVHWLSGTK